jgi:hypothetical protein
MMRDVSEEKPAELVITAESLDDFAGKSVRVPTSNASDSVWRALGAEPVAGNTDDEQIVRPFVEDQFDGYARIRASENGRKRRLP